MIFGTQYPSEIKLKPESYKFAHVCGSEAALPW